MAKDTCNPIPICLSKRASIDKMNVWPDKSRTLPFIFIILLLFPAFSLQKNVGQLRRFVSMCPRFVQFCAVKVEHLSKPNIFYSIFRHTEFDSFIEYIILLIAYRNGLPVLLTKDRFTLRSHASDRIVRTRGERENDYDSGRGRP